MEDDIAATTVDLANTGYALMLRLLAYSYMVPRPLPEKALAVDLSLGLMRAVTSLGERGRRACQQGHHIQVVTRECRSRPLRDAAALPPSVSAGRFFCETFDEMVAAANELAKTGDSRTSSAARILTDLAKRAAHASKRPPPFPEFHPHQRITMFRLSLPSHQRQRWWTASSTSKARSSR